ncbi:MAG: dimethyl sulfoxide reductase anchor subunit family protein [Steroidobacteraceae bacterium]
MRPAASILLLTTLTGFAYGLLAWLGVYDALGAAGAAERILMLSGIGLAVVLATAGLAASALHLGRRERAWRAFSQWRSSWLSREGVAALLTYPVALAFAACALRSPSAPLTRLLGAAAALSSLGTVYCTAMIYGSLKPIRQWHNPHTAPDYLIFALFSGGTLFVLLRTVVIGAAAWPAGLAGLAALAALLAKLAYWRYVDHQQPLATLASAIGMAHGTEVRALDAPHFTENFVLREMGFQIARRHGAKLRRLALTVGFLLPLMLSLLGASGGVPLVSSALAVVCAALGLLTERWLFFAQATHVSALYYGRSI